jgi:FkbM family methyltransferase
MKKIPIDFNHELVRTNKFKAVLRFFNWQLRSRLFRRDFIHEWVGGSKFYVKSGETGLTQNIYVGLADFEDMSFLLHCLQEGDLFLDIGSNSGSYSILGGAVARAKVVAVEPVPEIYKRLLRNLEINQLNETSIALNIGLGAKLGFLTMTSTLDTTNHIIIGETQRVTTQVEISTLDEISRNISPTLIKVDVEGWEAEVLTGGLKTLQNPKLLGLILELNESGLRYGFSDAEIVETLKSFEFEPYSYDPLKRSLRRLPGKNRKGRNTIFIRDEVETMKRLKRAPRWEILGSSI